MLTAAIARSRQLQEKIGDTYSDVSLVGLERSTKNCAVQSDSASLMIAHDEPEMSSYSA